MDTLLLELQGISPTQLDEASKKFLSNLIGGGFRRFSSDS
jgi:hypothetical protein